MSELYMHIPFQILSEHFDFIKNEKFNIEIRFEAEVLDDYLLSAIEPVARNLLENNIKVTAHAPFTDLNTGSLDQKIRDLTFRRYMNTLKLAEMFNASILVVHTGYIPLTHKYILKKWLQNCLNFFEKFFPFCESAGIYLAIENVFDENLEVLSALNEHFQSKFFGFCLDTGHFNVFFKKSLEDFLKMSQNRLIEMHIHDNKGIIDTHEACGTGTVDFDEIFNKLSEYNLAPLIVIENRSQSDIIKSANFIMQRGDYNANKG